jgi:hypothetical protein
LDPAKKRQRKVVRAKKGKVVSIDEPTVICTPKELPGSGDES